MYFWIPTSDFFKASKEDEYNIFFLILAVSGHQDIRNSFCFLEAWIKTIDDSSYYLTRMLNKTRVLPQ